MLVQVTMEGTYFGQQHINIIHVQQDDVTTIQYLGLADIIDNYWIDWHRINVDNNMRWNKIIIKDKSEGEAQYEWPVSRAGVLGPSVQACPFICACFNFYSNGAGRRGRGRNFVGGYGHTSQFNAGQWLTSTQNRLDGVASELWNYWVEGRTQTAGWRLCLAARNETLTGLYVDRIVGRSFVSTQNRRKIGRGQ